MHKENFYFKKIKLSLVKAVLEAAANGEKLAAQLGTSKKYKYWKSIDDEKRCLDCESNHGLVFETYDHYLTFYEIV